jgi:mannose-6-phosphate isomerase-like protein (cupin superfamily)
LRNDRAGEPEGVLAIDPSGLELAEAWQDGDERARWRSAAATTPTAGTAASGSSVLEVDPGRRLPRHVDSAEETIIVLSGAAEVVVGEESARVPTGGLVVVPADVPHEVRNLGRVPLRFVALYAGTDVVTRYEEPVQPDGARERSPLSC